MFFFNDTATTEIYTLSLHDALPISAPQAPALGLLGGRAMHRQRRCCGRPVPSAPAQAGPAPWSGKAPDRELAPGGPREPRSEEHTSELQSRQYLVCRLLLEKKTVPPTFPRSPVCTVTGFSHCAPYLI